MSSIKQGYIYWIDAEPHAGREEGGHSVNANNIRRPVIVVSNDKYNKGGMAIVFPLTSTTKNSRYLLPISFVKPSKIILTQILGYDMIARNAKETKYQVSNKELNYLKMVVSHYL